MEAIGRLAGGIAHDFNNVLQVIPGYSDVLLRSADGDHPLRFEIEQIDYAARPAAVLVDPLPTFSRQRMSEPTVLDEAPTPVCADRGELE